MMKHTLFPYLPSTDYPLWLKSTFCIYIFMLYKYYSLSHVESYVVFPFLYIENSFTTANNCSSSFISLMWLF